jgi:hypothetical protein
MKKFYLLATALITCTVSFGQTFLAGQDFDTENSWIFTADPATYFRDDGKDVWAAVASLSTNNSLDTPVAGTLFWGMRDLDNPYVGEPVDSGGLGLGNPYDHTLAFDNYSVSGYTDVSVSFSYNAYSLDTGYLRVEFFFDDAPQGLEDVFTYEEGKATNTWEKFTQSVPAGTGNVRMTIHAYDNQDYLAVDDVRIQYGAVGPTCDLVLGNTSAECDTSTDETDTYTAMINFTGGSSETYTITPSAGTVGGDDPGSVAAGKIIVSGLSEGTDLTVTVTGGVCNLEATISSPTCTPALPLPVYDPFDYAPGSELSASASWNNENDGDPILVSDGNLSYPDLVASSGNSVSFSGDGSESVLKFTTVSSGIVYASFIFKITDMTGFTTGGYFAVMGDYNARLYVKPELSQFYIGIGQTNKIDETKFALDKYDLNQEIFLVMSYDLTTRWSDVWINPAAGDFEAENAPASDATMPNGTALEIGQFILRQDNTAKTPSVTVDELRIGLSWAEVTPKSPFSSVRWNTSGFTVFPHPVTEGYLQILTDGPGEMSVRIFDMLGKQVYSKARHVSGTIDVSHLEKGVYFMKIEKEGRNATGKFIIR